MISILTGYPTFLALFSIKITLVKKKSCCLIVKQCKVCHADNYQRNRSSPRNDSTFFMCCATLGYRRSCVSTASCFLLFYVTFNTLSYLFVSVLRAIHANSLCNYSLFPCFSCLHNVVKVLDSLGPHSSFCVPEISTSECKNTFPCNFYFS